MMSQIVMNQPNPSTSTADPAKADSSGSSSNDNTLWGIIKKEGKRASIRASIAAQQTKITAELIFVEKNILKRQKKFGVELYDTLVVHAEQDPTFLIDGDTLENIRGHFVTAFKDNKALLQKKASEQQALVELEEQKQQAYPKEAPETFTASMKNAGIAANFASKEAAVRNRIYVLDGDMKSNKKKFGVAVYAVLVEMEDQHKWLSPDRDVRFLYDAARRDIDKLLTEKQQKEAEWKALGETKV